MKLYINTDNFFQLQSLTDVSSGTEINNATVTVQITTDAGINVGSSFTLAAAGSAGLYTGTLPHATAALLTQFTRYLIVVTIVSGSLQSVQKELAVADNS